MGCAVAMTALLPLLLMMMMMISAPAGMAQESSSGGRVAPPGVKGVLVPFASLKPEATFKIGENADWVQITDDAVWVASSNPASVHRIDPKTMARNAHLDGSDDFFDRPAVRAHWNRFC